MDAGWRQSIFDKLGHIPGCLVVAGDPDGLLTEEKTANMLEVLGLKWLSLMTLLSSGTSTSLATDHSPMPSPC